MHHGGDPRRVGRGVEGRPRRAAGRAAAEAIPRQRGEGLWAELMHSTVVCLIWQRELRDLLRDRRWLFMLLGLPVLLYPVFGLVGFVFAVTMLDHEIRVGVVGLENLPRPVADGPVGPSGEFAWLAAVPTPACGIDIPLGPAAAVLALR